MLDVSEIFHDLYVILAIEFYTDDEHKTLVTDQVYDHLKFLSIGLGLKQDSITIQLHEGDKQWTRFLNHKHYEMSLVATFNSVTHSNLLIIERTFRGVIEFWNECVFHRNFKEAFFRMEVYEKGKRP